MHWYLLSRIVRDKFLCIFDGDGHGTSPCHQTQTCEHKKMKAMMHSTQSGQKGLKNTFFNFEKKRKLSTKLNFIPLA